MSDTSKCGICSELLTDGAHCTACNLMVHYHCGGVNEAGYRRLDDRKHIWRCSKCKQAGNTMPASPRSPLSVPDSAVLQEIRALSEKFAAFENMKEDILALKNEFVEFKTSLVNQHNEVMKEITGKINDMEQRIVQVEKVQSQVEQLQSRIVRLEEDQKTKINGRVQTTSKLREYRRQAMRTYLILLQKSVTKSTIPSQKIK